MYISVPLLTATINTNKFSYYRQWLAFNPTTEQAFWITYINKYLWTWKAGGRWYSSWDAAHDSSHVNGTQVKKRLWV